MLSRFDRYLLSQLMMFFGFFALVLVSIYWVNSAALLFDRLISDNQSVWVFLELTALSLPNVIRLMLPVAAFVATIYATHRMASESELVVMQATGLSPYRMARPVVYFGLIVALFLSALNHFLVPMARTRLNERNTEISQNISAKFLTEGAFLHPSAGVTLFIREITPVGELRDLFLSDQRASDGDTTYSAKRAFLARSESGPKLVMVDGLAQSFDHVTQRLAITRFADFTYDIRDLIATQGPRVPTLDERATPALLWPSADLLEETRSSLAKALFEGHDRFAKPLLTMALAFVAFAAMQSGSFSRFGMWRQIALASGLFVFLFFLSNLVDKSAARAVEALWLVYLPPFLGAGLGLFLMAIGSRNRHRPSTPPAPTRGVMA
ncbi:MAG: LPS export ABC transporter permease LptF [Paracoccaceae bacterium]